MKKLNEDYKTIKDHNKSYVPLPTTSQVLCHSCANSPQGQTVQRSEKLHLGLYRPQPARQMLMFITVQCMALSKGLKWKPRLSKRNMTAQICKDRTEKKKTSGTMVFSVQRTEWRCLAIKHRTLFVKNQTQHISANSSYQLPSTVGDVGWYGLVLQPQDPSALQPLSWPWNPQLILTPEA